MQGPVFLTLPFSMRVLIGVGLVAVLCAGVFLSSVSFARKETVTGWTTLDSGVLRVPAAEAGTIMRVLVREGQKVRAGQPLVELRLGQATDRGDAADILGLEIGRQQRAELAKLDADATAASALGEQARATLRGLEQSLGEARRREQLQREQIVIARRSLDRLQKIADRGFVTKRSIDEATSTLLDAQSALSTTRAAVLDVEGRIVEAKADAAAYPISMGRIRAMAASTRASYAQRQVENSARGRSVIVAPRDGEVMMIYRRPGESVAQNGVVAAIGNAGGRLEVELFVPTRAAGFVANGQPVRLMYQAFPFQRFGAATGRITSVSETVLAPSEVSIPGMTFQEPLFRVRVRPDRDYVAAYGDRHRVRAGMLLTSDIVLEQRSLGKFLLDPLFAAGRRL